jgi:two-component system sensor histidine kinase KdpD
MADDRPNPNAESGQEPRPTAFANRDARGYAAAAFVTTAAIAIGWPLYHGLRWPDPTATPHFANTNVLMLFLLGVLWVATHHSRSAAIASSIMAVAAFDFLFVPPYLTFTVSDQQYLLTFGVMLLTALTISTLTHRVRAQAESARARERRTAALLALSRELAAARTSDEIAESAVRHVHDVMGRRVTLILADRESHLSVKCDSNGSGSAYPETELGVAQWAFEHGKIAGRGTHALPAAEGTYVPMCTSRGVVGVLGLSEGNPDPWLPEHRQLAEAFASQTALAVERATLAEEARVAWERVEAEFLRNTLLSGMSHELRTPLAGITGAATALIDTESKLAPEARIQLLETLIGEAERMERLINNLLDMTRLEAGGLSMNREWQPLNDVISATLHHLARRLKDRALNLAIPDDLPLLLIDGVAIEQVMINLVENALEYAPAPSPIDIIARQAEHEIVIEVADRGPGLAAGTERRVFEKFFRAAQGSSRRGIGLGLAICRGIVESHGGRISANNREGGGAVFTFTLPMDEAPPSVDREPPAV